MNARQMAGAAALARAAAASASASASMSAAKAHVKPSAPSAAAISARSHAAEIVRILTFNLYFDPIGMAPRMRAIGRMVESYRPAILGFQEVTRESLGMLRAQRWAKYYDCSVDAHAPFSEAYFVVLFSALPVRWIEALPFSNTGMGREVVAMCVEVAEARALIVGTSHLESLPQFQRQRVSQFQQSLQWLNTRVEADATTCLGAIFMGDTNLMRGDMKLLDPRCAVEEIMIERAKTGRARCRTCAEVIRKGDIRVGRQAKEMLRNNKVVEIVLWYHRDCFSSLQTSTEAEKQAVARWNARQEEEEQETKTDADTEADADTDAPDAESAESATLGLPQGWHDLWLMIDGNTNENGYTYDGKRNGLISNRSYQSRFDRMYFLPGPRLADQDSSRNKVREVLQSIKMVGTEPISDGLWPSDHFGLLATLRFVNSPSTQAEDDSKSDTSGGDQPKASPGSRSTPIQID